jgi:hypothetical protein
MLLNDAGAPSQVEKGARTGWSCSLAAFERKRATQRVNKVGGDLRRAGKARSWGGKEMTNESSCWQ